MYNKIYDFCKVRNYGNVFNNNPNSLTPRVEFIIRLLESHNISYQIDKFPISGTFGYNIILQGNSSRLVVAHHDVNNHKVDNANDNSASVINAIALKKLKPELTVVLLDGEEFGGLGSQRLSTQINQGKFGDVDWVLNLELTGKGGKYFFIGNYPGKLYEHIKNLFDCPVCNTPYNDSVTFRKNGIDSCVINPLPPVKNGKSNVQWNDGTYLDFSILYNCHTNSDSIDSIDTNDMRIFVEQVLLKIFSN